MKLKTKIFSVLAAVGLTVLPATAQVVSQTAFTPVAVSVAYTGQVPTNASTSVAVTCNNLVGVNGSMTQTAAFTAAGGTITLQFPLQPVTVNGGSNCTFAVTSPGEATVSVGGLVRTGAVPVTQATTAAVTVALPGLTVKSQVTGDGPDQFDYVMNCNVPLNPAVFNGVFTLKANGSRTFGLSDIPGVTLNTKCEVRQVNAFGGTLAYTSTNGTQTVNGVTSPVLVGGVFVNGVFQSALTDFRNQTITVQNGFPVKPTVPATTTTVAPTTTQATTTLPPATVPATTAVVTTALPIVVAAPPVAIEVEPSFTG